MIIDQEYYKQLHGWIQQQDGKTFNIDDLTEDYEKFTFHLKFYINNRTAEDQEVEFNSLTETEEMYGANYAQFRVLEFFEGKVKSNQAASQGHGKIQAGRIQMPAAQVAKVQAANKEIVKNNLKTPGLFQ